MGLQKCGLNLNRKQRELQPHGTIAFPCAGYSELHTNKPEDVIPWHWHEELEIVYIKNGELRLQIPAVTFDLKKGDCIVINSSILHYGYTAACCELCSLVFSPMLIAGTSDSVFTKKYLSPLISCPSFHAFLLTDGNNRKEIGDFINAFEALACDADGMEFTVRESLSHICFFLYQQFEKNMGILEKHLDLDNLRMRKMLDYIHENFAENITLAQIAKEADIGERECLRCFKRTIQTSPMQYLVKYKILQSAALLLQNPSHSISEIAMQCGFDSPSNFSKMFRRFYACTPKEYKNRHRNAEEGLL